ncbi:MAG TPA: hypothetical protein VF733_01280 [Candidatus Saccharimonadales bacterium]
MSESGPRHSRRLPPIPSDSSRLLGASALPDQLGQANDFIQPIELNQGGAGYVHQTLGASVLSERFTSLYEHLSPKKEAKFVRTINDLVRSSCDQVVTQKSILVRVFGRYAHRWDVEEVASFKDMLSRDSRVLPWYSSYAMVPDKGDKSAYARLIPDLNEVLGEMLSSGNVCAKFTLQEAVARTAQLRGLAGVHLSTRDERRLRLLLQSHPEIESRHYRNGDLAGFRYRAIKDWDQRKRQALRSQLGEFLKGPANYLSLDGIVMKADFPEGFSESLTDQLADELCGNSPAFLFDPGSGILITGGDRNDRLQLQAVGRVIEESLHGLKQEHESRPFPINWLRARVRAHCRDWELPQNIELKHLISRYVYRHRHVRVARGDENRYLSFSPTKVEKQTQEPLSPQPQEESESTKKVHAAGAEIRNLAVELALDGQRSMPAGRFIEMARRKLVGSLGDDFSDAFFEDIQTMYIVGTYWDGRSEFLSLERVQLPENPLPHAHLDTFAFQKPKRNHR